ncbi:hypothetical protein L3Q82_018454, partial [Scortum barcoo]
EYSHAIIIITIYIPPVANESRATDLISSVTARLQTLYPSAFIAISGDFNHANLSSSLPTFKQFVDCKTRDKKTLDANVKETAAQLSLLSADQIWERTSENCITDYVNFCMNNIIPAKTTELLPPTNNKPWVTKDIKDRKKAAFRRGDKEELKKVQTELREKIAEGKDCYRRKLESRLQQNNMREVWSGLKTITGHGKKASQMMEGDLHEANKLNLFFN